jgi:hypothetical protein
MALNNYVYIFRGIDMNPQQDQAEIKNPKFRFLAVGVSQLEEAIDVAKKALQEGAQAIELCGAFGEKGKKMIVEAIENKIPVGNACYE